MKVHPESTHPQTMRASVDNVSTGTEMEAWGEMGRGESKGRWGFHKCRFFFVCVYIYACVHVCVGQRTSAFSGNTSLDVVK